MTDLKNELVRTTPEVGVAPVSVTIPNVIDVSDEILRVMKSYATTRSFNLLLRGAKGVGKTLVIAKSARPPVLIHSFDPNGTVHLTPGIESGRVVVDRTFEQEDARHPSAYVTWERMFDIYRTKNVFERFGTYCIDSLTFWLEACRNYVATMHSARGTPLANDGQLEIKGWGVVVQMMSYMIKLVNSLPCDFILTAHSRMFSDESSGMLMEGIAVPPSLQIPVPAVFSEYYLLKIDNNSKADAFGNKGRLFLTSNSTRELAGTRIGRDKFLQYEPANISYLLKKAGWTWEDKSLQVKK